MKIGNPSKDDDLIFEEKSEAFTVGIGIAQTKNTILYPLQITTHQSNIILILMKKILSQN